MNKLLKTLLPMLFITAVQLQPAMAAEVMKPKAVVELFTSQGCSSCPPADKLLGKLAMEKETLALAWHVDYWDYLGWKDSFASKANTTRQRRYAISLGQNQIYTPQAVINGRVHVIGSHEAKLRQAIAKYSKGANGLTVPIDTSFTADGMTVNVEATADSQNTTLWIVYFNNHQKVDVKRGENHGKVLEYSNVVQDIQMVGMVDNGQSIHITLPLHEIKRIGADSCALVLQRMTRQGTPGAIVGAAVITDL
ncbi:MAG: hypothetical protein COB78_11100 [Hyphomicrobiales bacterium]|nr:MAG: hypothetical protein COB78_11100 [Hyphomicrobiales bacterium]